MTNINLLPWRDELRAQKQKDFYTVLVVLIVASLLGIFAWINLVNKQISDQESRNRLIKKEISRLEIKVAEIKNLKKQRAELLDRMEVIQSLQGNRPVIVRVFDDLVRQVPDGVYFNNMQRKSSELIFDGISESNNRVSSLMRRLEASDWFSEPNLIGVQKIRTGALLNDGESPNKFNMTVKITMAKKEKNDS